MAVVPGQTLASWLGTGAGTAAVTTTAGSHYVIPKAGVQTYVGGAADTVISDDIRDFLFSVLSKCADAYSAPVGAADTRTTNVAVSRAITAGATGVASFNVTIRGGTFVSPVITTLGTYG